MNGHLDIQLQTESNHSLHCPPTILDDLIHLPKAPPRKRTRKTQRSEIVTGSPFKQLLEEKEEAKRIKLSKKTAQGKARRRAPKKDKDQSKIKNSAQKM